MVRQDFEWLEKLYSDQYNAIYRYVRHHLQEYASDHVDDIVQETFLLAVKKDIRNHPRPDAWLYVTAHNLCMNYIHSIWRQQKKLSTLEQEHLRQQRMPHPFESAVDGDSDATDLMLTLRAELSPQDLLLIREYCIKGTPAKELSEKTGLSVSHIRVRIHRIRKHVEKLLLIFVLCFLSLHIQ